MGNLSRKLAVAHHHPRRNRGRGHFCFPSLPRTAQDHQWVGMIRAEGKMSAIGIWTKPLARRTLPRARGSAVVEGLKKEVSWVTEIRRSL